ncbi:MAG: trypsin-like peptidase domain-containing protein [Planctomycetota bacterium]|nr:trypsin-like peptidase domain-containing protein [Planctomycetota bacterium]MDA1162213.1 trypsin-like peptidase domain-containing protein [Planctomycetota bacterium]
MFRVKHVGLMLSFGVAIVGCFVQTSLAAGSGSSFQTIDYVLPRMVKIFGAGGLQGLAAYGSGFLVSKEGHIVTVWSHVLDANEVIVVLNDGRRYTATVLGAEPQLELAVLKISEDTQDLDLPFFDLESGIGSASEGTRVLGFSNMFKVATGDEAVSVLHGVVAAKTKLKTRRGTFEIPYDGAVYVVDAITNNSGAAGGLLTTREGKLLGMIGREVRNAETNTWLNYSIPIAELTTPIREIISGEFRSQRQPIDEPTPELRYSPMDFGIVMVPDVLFRTPAYVNALVEASAAHKMKLQPDDLVLFVNDDLVQSVRELSAAFGRLEAGDVLRLVVRRDDQLLTFEMPVPRKSPPVK